MGNTDTVDRICDWTVCCDSETSHTVAVAWHHLEQNTDTMDLTVLTDQLWPNCRCNKRWHSVKRTHTVGLTDWPDTWLNYRCSERWYSVKRTHTVWAWLIDQPRDWITDELPNADIQSTEPTHYRHDWLTIVCDWTYNRSDEAFHTGIQWTEQLTSLWWSTIPRHTHDTRTDISEAALLVWSQSVASKADHDENLCNHFTSGSKAPVLRMNKKNG